MHLVVRHAGRKLHSTIAGAEAVECQPVFEAEHSVDEQPLEKSWDEALSQFMEAKELPQKRSAGTLATKHASFVIAFRDKSARARAQPAQLAAQTRPALQQQRSRKQPERSRKPPRPAWHTEGPAGHRSRPRKTRVW